MTDLTRKFIRHKRLLAIAGVTILLIIFGTVLNSDKLKSSVVGTIDTSTYQAIHLDTGETYFGKITEAEENFITITDVYYFLDESKKKLVKRGKDAHAPEDSFTINHSRVLAIENLSEDSPVVKAILKYRKNKN